MPNKLSYFFIFSEFLDYWQDKGTSGANQISAGASAPLATPIGPPQKPKWPTVNPRKWLPLPRCYSSRGHILSSGVGET